MGTGLRHPGTATITPRLPLLSIPRADVYKFGHAPPSAPLLAGLEWTIQDNPGEAWAIVGHGSARKIQLLETLRGNHRIHPAPPLPHGPWPALTAAGIDPYTSVSLVSFAHRASAGAPGFLDYTARYGALRDEDRVTLRSLLGLEDKEPAVIRRAETLVEKLGLGDLLDLPAVALSNGQTRRARIIRALLLNPHVLLLDEPLTGLDINMRTLVSNVLRDLHQDQAPRVLLGLRAQDPIPDWITSVLDVDVPGLASGGSHLKASDIWSGSRSAWEAKQESSGGRPSKLASSERPDKGRVNQGIDDQAEALADLRNIRISYGDRHVLRGIDWTIRPGERWHLSGANGSGKTTLLALLTGEHPLSFAQRCSSSLTLFGRPRHTLASADLVRQIGRVGTEMGDAMPRVQDRTVWQVVGTGFEGSFVPRGKDSLGAGISDKERHQRSKRMWEVLRALGPASWSGSSAITDDAPDKLSAAFACKAFVDCSPGERALVLLARALVGRPGLVILDEAWAGMDSGMIEAARRFLRSEAGVGREQAVIVVSHWAEEVPWTREEGLKSITLDEGKAIVSV